MIGSEPRHSVEALKVEQEKKMSTKLTIEETRKHRLELKKIKVVSRKMEMIADRFLVGGAMIQFCRDVSLYGLWEALMYADSEELNAEMVEEFVNRI